MKANGAPERIYLQVCGDCNVNDCYNCKFEDLEDNVTWCKDKIFDKDIEYTRTDAFIEKALEFLDGCIPDYIDLEHANVDTFMNVDNKRFIEDFKKYMKEE